ncbi:MAG: type II toxin-antitoxin system death-on-curing family toxin [Planctomycetia bacterium]
MHEPVWITEEDCLSFHEKFLARFGGSSGLRDHGLLASALTLPQHLFSYERPTLFDMAAAYAHGIVKNHPLVDGNKRSGLLAAAVFLEANGVRFFATEEDAVVQTLGLAAGAITARDFAAWLEKVCRPEGVD